MRDKREQAIEQERENEKEKEIERVKERERKRERERDRLAEYIARADLMVAGCMFILLTEQIKYPLRMPDLPCDKVKF